MSFISSRNIANAIDNSQENSNVQTQPTKAYVYIKSQFKTTSLSVMKDGNSLEFFEHKEVNILRIVTTNSVWILVGKCQHMPPKIYLDNMTKLHEKTSGKYL